MNFIFFFLRNYKSTGTKKDLPFKFSVSKKETLKQQPDKKEINDDDDDDDDELSPLEVLDATLDILTKLLKLLQELGGLLRDKKSDTVHPKSSDITGRIKRNRFLYLYPVNPNKRDTDTGFEDISVNFYHHTGYKIYDMQAKHGDFITGEVGRIDTDTGEAPQVRDNAEEVLESNVAGSEIHNNRWESGSSNN